MNFLGRVFFLLLITISGLAHPEVRLGEMRIHLLDELPENLLDELPESFTVQSFTCNADISVDERELETVLSISKSEITERHQLLNGIENLKRKQKFSDLVITYEIKPDGVSIQCSLTSIRTLRKMTITGSIAQKDRYQRYYFLAIGEPFNETYHSQALEMIQQALRDDGFLDARLDVTIKNVPTMNSVEVVITVHPGKIFTIDEIAIQAYNVKTPTVVDEKVMQESRRILEPLLRYNPYSKVTLQSATDSLRQALQSEGYSDAEVNHTLEINDKKKTVCVSFSVKVGEQKKYIFEGNHFFDADQLKRAGLLFGPSVPTLPSAVVVEEIIRLYKDSGFLDAKAECREEGSFTFIEIDEGCRSKIIDVDIKGVEASDKERVVKNYFNELLDKEYYDTQLINTCCDALLEWFFSQGYWDCTIVSQSVKETSRIDEHILVIEIKRGDQRLLENVALQDFEELAKEDPFKSFQGLLEPMPFDLHIVKKQQQWLGQFLQKKGYLYSSFVPEFKQGKKGFILVWKLSGPLEPVTFGKTIIVGANSIPSYVLLRELEYQEGDPWDVQAIHKSISRLKSLSIFDFVSLQPSDIFKPEGAKTMLLNVVEDDPFELKGRLGLGFIGRNIEIRGGATYRVGASFLWKNPSKRGDLVRFDADITRYTSDVALCYQLPWIGPWRVKTQFKGYASNYLQPFVIGSRDILYDAVHRGFSTRFSSRYKFLEWGLNCGFEWMKISGLSRRLASVLKFEPNLIDQFFPYYVCEPTLFIDTLDNKVAPKRGSLSVLSIRGMFPLTLRDAWYIKVLAEESVFFPLASWLVCGLRFRCGHIFGAPFKRIMPTERFYLGGAWSLRGYEPDHAPPLNRFKDRSGHEHLVPIGGSSLLNMNAELRFPLYKDIGGVVFTDMGALSQNNLADIKRKNILGATGFGLRYDTPVGSVRFDIGWKWKKRFENDSSFVWFLTLGQAF